jgi:hypothetical protein
MSIFLYTSPPKHQSPLRGDVEVFLEPPTGYQIATEVTVTQSGIEATTL